MKKVYLGLLSCASIGFSTSVLAEDATAPTEGSSAQVGSQPASSHFTSAQLAEIDRVIGSYLTKNPAVVMAAFQAGMEQQQKETVVKMEKAVAENKDKLFKDAAAPVAGNRKGTQSLVVFLDPNCGHCKKLYGELVTLLDKNRDVKITFKDFPIMGGAAILAVKAMLAAKEQGKYEELQKVVFESEKPLTKKQLLKAAASIGLDAKKLEADMKKKGIQAQIDSTVALAKVIGINGTPALIIGETKVVPGYVGAEELNKMLSETKAQAS